MKQDENCRYIVGYTISDDELRSKVRDFFERELELIRINESMYKGSGVENLKGKIEEFCKKLKGNGYKFSQYDFIKLYYPIRYVAITKKEIENGYLDVRDIFEHITSGIKEYNVLLN